MRVSTRSCNPVRAGDDPGLRRGLRLSVTPVFAQAPTLSCETFGVYHHCRDSHGNTVVTEDRSGEYVHGHDNRGGGGRRGSTMAAPTRGRPGDASSAGRPCKVMSGGGTQSEIAGPPTTAVRRRYVRRGAEARRMPA
jgi:hypothetical protein